MDAPVAGCGVTRTRVLTPRCDCTRTAQSPCNPWDFGVCRNGMDLFSQSARKRHVGEPLAERMRPRTLAEMVGQAHLLAPGKILSNLAPGRAIPSLLLWGPPGSGKTTLARLLGETLRAELTAQSAVEAAVTPIREAIAKAAVRRDRGAPGGRAGRPARGRAAAHPSGDVPGARTEVESRADHVRGRPQAGQG